MKRLVPGLLSLAVVLAACGGQATPPPTTQLTPGGTLREALVKPASLDPALAGSVSERTLADQIYDGLTAWNPDTLIAEASLAKSWSSGEQNRQWTFVLDETKVASNGEPITANDVKLSLEHVARSGSNSPSGDLLSTVVGYSDYVAGVTNDLLGVAITSNNVVTVTTTDATASLPMLLGNPMFGITHYTATGGATTGPFSIKSSTDAGIELVKAPKSKALLDGISGSFFADVNAAYASFDAGNADWSPVGSAEREVAASKYGNTGFVPSLRTLYLSFNLVNPALSDVRVRQGIARALDRSKIAASMSLDAEPLTDLVPRTIPGAVGGACGASCSFDVVAARSLIDRVFPNGSMPAFDIAITSAAPFNEATRALIETELKDAHVNARVVFADENFGDIVLSPDRAMFQTGWTAAYPSFDAFLNPLFLSSSASNVAGVRDADADQLLVAAQTSTDSAAQLTSWQKASKQLLDDQVAVPLAMFPIDTVKQSRVHGIRVLPTGNFDPTRVWLSR